MSNMFFSEKCPSFVREIMTELGKEESRQHWKEALVQAAEHELESQLGEGACMNDLLYRLLAHIDDRLLDTKETAIDLAYIAFDIATGNQKNRLPGTYDSLRVHFDNAVEALAADAAATKPKDGCNPPWHKSPKVVSAPPSQASSPSYIKNWKPQPPGSVVPDEVKQPGMEKHRFDLIDWRLNGFEQRLGELEARLPIATGNDSGELAKIADLLNYVAGMVAAQGNDPDSGNATDLEMNLCAASKKLAHLAGVIPPFKGRPDRECPVCSEPEDKPHAPDCEYAVLDSLHLPGMETSRLKAMDWRFNGIEERLGTVECNASAFRLTAMQEQIDRLTAHLESLSAAHESLHNTYWKQSYDVGSRLESLENRAPC